MQHEVTIARLGAQGDGVAEGPEGPLFVPFTLPGELTRVEIEPDGKHASLLEVLEPSPERVTPLCPHFGICGGCSLQHLEEVAYLGWKREQVVAALKSRGLDLPVEPVRPAPLASRRRASLALGRGPAGLALGYRRLRSHELVDVKACPVLSPSIVARLSGLKAALAPLLSGKRETLVSVTETDSGLDVVVTGARSSRAALTALIAKATELGLARLTLDGETMALLARPTINLSGAAVKLPPGAFLQASRAAEAVLVELVREGVGGAKRVADLFAGVGTFTFALAATAEIDAFEEDDAALAALTDAARMTPKLKPIRTFRRDLFREPLRPKELGHYDAVVLDPPRAGAAAQAEALATSDVARLVAVSCNPGTLARDLRILVDGGYRVIRIVPVDQFLFSPHIEVVAELER
jgi:23S rRNA (uracil1939-C5)-methyltransferase